MLAYYLVLFLGTVHADRVYLEQWMSNLGDTLNLSQVSLPGTHYSAASSLYPLSGAPLCTQNLSIKDQLYAGIRFFHIAANVASDNVTLNTVRNGYFTPWTYQEIQNFFTEFLDTHHHEVLVVRLVEETVYPSRELFAKVFQNIINPKSTYYWNQTGIPLLGDLRRKIFIIQDFVDPDSKFLKMENITFENAPLGNCSDEGLTQHMMYVTQNIQTASSEKGNSTLYLTNTDAYLITNGTINCTSLQVSYNINPRVEKLLSNTTLSRSDGMLSIAYPSSSLIGAIINNNGFSHQVDGEVYGIASAVVLPVILLLLFIGARGGYFTHVQNTVVLMTLVIFDFLISIWIVWVYQRVSYRDFGTRFSSGKDLEYFFVILGLRVVMNSLFLAYVYWPETQGKLAVAWRWMIFACDYFFEPETCVVVSVQSKTSNTGELTLTATVTNAGKKITKGEVTFDNEIWIPFPSNKIPLDSNGIATYKTHLPGNFKSGKYIILGTYADDVATYASTRCSVDIITDNDTKASLPVSLSHDKWGVALCKVLALLSSWYYSGYYVRISRDKSTKIIDFLFIVSGLFYILIQFYRYVSFKLDQDVVSYYSLITAFVCLIDIIAVGLDSGKLFKHRQESRNGPHEPLIPPNGVINA